MKNFAFCESNFKRATCLRARLNDGKFLMRHVDKHDVPVWECIVEFHVLLLVCASIVREWAGGSFSKHQ